MKKVADFELMRHGWDTEDDFAGYSNVGTGYRFCVTGGGGSPHDALEEVFDLMSKYLDIDIADLEPRVRAQYGEFPADSPQWDSDDLFYFISILFDLEDEGPKQ